MSSTHCFFSITPAFFGIHNIIFDQNSLLSSNRDNDRTHLHRLRKRWSCSPHLTRKLVYLCRRSFGTIAQLVEQRTENPCVPGSNPIGTTTMAAQCAAIFDLCVNSHRVQQDSPTWIEALQNANADRVVWVHEQGLDPELLENTDPHSIRDHRGCL